MLTLAAAALCHVAGFSSIAMVNALRSFKGLPHRVEKINKINGIEFFDDSKGTNVGATVAALSGLQQPLVRGTLLSCAQRESPGVN